MSEVIRSIFRQREIEKLYELKEIKNYDIYFDTTYHYVMAVGNYEKVISDKEIGR